MEYFYKVSYDAAKGILGHGCACMVAFHIKAMPIFFSITRCFSVL